MIEAEIRTQALAGAKLSDLVERYGVSWGTLHPVVRSSFFDAGPHTTRKRPA